MYGTRADTYAPAGGIDKDAQRRGATEKRHAQQILKLCLKFTCQGWGGDGWNVMRYLK
ncbi:hypothetical protein [Pseudosulfitobacter pseudonitzschiae]|uniref:hypothetical protein n=1 Tax=Pseudosulfitobacter pseudonitzschiae TaxID=1402135 RepID=UPI001C310E0B|nr:hypothetical protein [Pseudosulfitobacter pseudonitzschiae]